MTLPNHQEPVPALLLGDSPAGGGRRESILEALSTEYLWRLAGKASELGLDAFQASEQSRVSQWRMLNFDNRKETDRQKVSGRGKPFPANAVCS